MSKEYIKTGCVIHGQKDICGHTTESCPVFLNGVAANENSVVKITNEDFDKRIKGIREIYKNIEKLKAKLRFIQQSNRAEFLETHKKIVSLSNEGIVLCNYFIPISYLNSDQEELIEIFFQEMQRNLLTSKRIVEESDQLPTA